MVTFVLLFASASLVATALVRLVISVVRFAASTLSADNVLWISAARFALNAY